MASCNTVVRYNSIEPLKQMQNTDAKRGIVLTKLQPTAFDFEITAHLIGLNVD